MGIKTLFVPCSIDGLPKESGSIRLRAIWPARYMAGAEVWDATQSLGDFQAFVFQKAYLGNAAREMIEAVAARREAGENVRLALDLVDPDMLDREHERRLSSVASLFDFVVTPTQSLAALVNETYTVPVRVIPDRVDLQDCDLALARAVRKVDEGTDKPTVIWGGYASNAWPLLAMKETINELGLPHKIMALERPLPFGEFWARVAAEGDILLNPKVEDGALQYKSENKTIIAWSLGMLVASSNHSLRLFCDPELRKGEIVRKLALARGYDVRQSVDDWMGMFAEFGLDWEAG